MITVEKAIRRGYIFVNIPVFIIMMGMMGGGLYLVVIKYFPSWMLPISIFGSPFVAWIYWSFAITKWRIWAFSKVDNIPALKLQAALDDLIWPEGSFFERTEIRTRRERELIKELENGFRKTKRKNFNS